MKSGWTQTDVDAYNARVHAGGKTPVPAIQAMPPVPAKTTQAELDAYELLIGMGFRIIETQHVVMLAAGPRYTADMLVEGRDGRGYIVEVKGGYRHASVQRSRLAFLSAVHETGLGGLWIERRKAGQGKPPHWRMEVYS